jgi:hypothetical protein
MSRHLSPTEFVAAVEGELAASRSGHLDACESCREELAALGAAAAAVRSDTDVPEPSPLFWDQLSTRVREAADAASSGMAVPWWARWQILATLGAAAAVTTLVVALNRTSAPEADPSIATASAPEAVGADEEPWRAVAAMASTLSSDDVRLAVASVPVTETPVEELTAAERRVFVELLQAEWGSDEWGGME